MLGLWTDPGVLGISSSAREAPEGPKVAGSVLNAAVNVGYDVLVFFRRDTLERLKRSGGTRRVCVCAVVMALSFHAAIAALICVFRLGYANRLLSGSPQRRACVAFLSGGCFSRPGTNKVRQQFCRSRCSF